MFDQIIKILNKIFSIGSLLNHFFKKILLNYYKIECENFVRTNIFL